MSKIDQIQPGQILPADKPSPAGRPQGGDSFQKILDQATQASQAAPTPANAPASQAAPTAPAAQASQVSEAAPVSPLQREGLLRAGRTLDLLDSYAQSLADPSQPLKKVAGLVQSLEQESRGLGQVLERMDPQDGLYGLLQEVASTAQVETIKFNRGDYLEG